MRNPDEKDLKILHLLAEDGRRSYSDIAEQVDLSGPAVSERVKRLEDQNIIKGFKVDINRSKLGNDLSVLVTLDAQPEHVERLHASLNELEDVEHVFSTVSSRVVFQAELPHDSNPRKWVVQHIDIGKISDYDIDIISEFDWNLNIKATEFTLACVECGKNITDGGVVAKVDGDIKQFCCTSCEARYMEQFEKLSGGTSAD